MIRQRETSRSAFSPLRAWIEAGPAPGDGRGRLGIWLFLAALAMLFGACVVALLSIRLRFEHWPPAGEVGLPRSLGIGALLIVLLSVAIEAALRAARRGEKRSIRRLVGAALLLALGFLAAQTAAWLQLYLAGGSITSGLHAFTFYVFSGLHAAHILGGLAPLAVVYRRSRRGLYDARRHAGIAYSRLYWHFLAAVWLLLYGLFLWI